MNKRACTPPLNAEHGSIVGITSTEYDALVSRHRLPSRVHHRHRPRGRDAPAAPSS